MRSDESFGILFIGFGAVASTIAGGVELIRTGKRPAVGCLSELGSLPLTGNPAEERIRLSEFLDLMPLGHMRFAGIDILETRAGDAAGTAGVFSREDLEALESFWESVPLYPGYFRESATPVLRGTHLLEVGEREDPHAKIQAVFKKALGELGCSRGMVVLSCSTETRPLVSQIIESQGAFESLLGREDESITPALCYTRAALEMGLPVINLTPNLTLEHPFLVELAGGKQLPVAGSDLKSGQTYMKTLIASGLQARLLNVSSWFSTNILGNRDGRILENQRALQAKKETKERALNELFDPGLAEELYQDLHQLVHIHYFPPKGDNKEAWDSISLEGFLGYPMELKINFQCRDSILAAPLVVDLIRFTELAWRKGQSGTLDWLAGYFKSPVFADPERRGKGHHFIFQMTLLEEALRSLAKE